MQRSASMDKRRLSELNLMKTLLDGQQIRHMCCRQTVLTFTDFYTARNAYAHTVF